MRAMVLHSPGQPLQLMDVPLPHPGAGQVLVRVIACGVCRTDLHIVDGELTGPKLPLIPGHEIVGRIVSIGADVTGWAPGARVGVPWLASTCGRCEFCSTGRENLCPQALFTGYTWDGGYADHTLADARFCLPLPGNYSDENVAPLLCAGLIGYRCLRKTGGARRVGLYGFGAAAHLVCQVAKEEGREIFAFTRPGDERAQQFAKTMGATWAGDTTMTAPAILDAAIIFAPAGELVPMALRAVGPGGCVVCGGIHMSDIPTFPYDILWHERTLCSVANLTRSDGEDFMTLASRCNLRTRIKTFPLAAANEALSALREGRLTGAGVLLPD